MAPRKNTKTVVDARSVDFTSVIYVGEDVIPSFPDDSSIEVILPDGTKETYSYPYTPINTSKWKTGMATVIIKDKGQRVEHFNIVDPTDIATNYNQLMQILNEIDLVIELRLTAGGVVQTTINNKTLISETLSSLYAIRSSYVKRINNELSKINKKQPNNPIKSISRFTRGGGYKF